jgi:Ribbon-helix-helix protein, copG family.
MATNLRLGPDAAQSVKAEAARSGRSQQDVIREAVDRYLLSTEATARSARSEDGQEPRKTWARPQRRIRLPRGATSLELLGRDDRL